MPFVVASSPLEYVLQEISFLSFLLWLVRLPRHRLLRPSFLPGPLASQLQLLQPPVLRQIRSLRNRRQVLTPTIQFNNNQTIKKSA